MNRQPYSYQEIKKRKEKKTGRKKSISIQKKISKDSHDNGNGTEQKTDKKESLQKERLKKWVYRGREQINESCTASFWAQFCQSGRVRTDERTDSRTDSRTRGQTVRTQTRGQRVGTQTRGQTGGQENTEKVRNKL